MGEECECHTKRKILIKSSKKIFYLENKTFTPSQGEQLLLLKTTHYTILIESETPKLAR